jgi:hypothetical protein
MWRVNSSSYIFIPIYQNLYFKLENEQTNKWEVHIYTTNKYEGQLIETKEAKEIWVEKSEIPYSDMWLDDIYWLPHVLFGKEIVGKFEFTSDWKEILNYDLQIKNIPNNL